MAIGLLLVIGVIITSGRAQPPATNVCKGTFKGVVEKVVDGDTLAIVGCSSHIRLALVNTPEFYESGYQEAKSFVAALCPPGAVATIDQDDLDPSDTHGRIVAAVWCGGKSVNSELIKRGLAKILLRFCSKSEFASEDWAWGSCSGALGR